MEVFKRSRYDPTAEEINTLSSIMFCSLRFVSLEGMKGIISRVLGACEGDRAAVSVVLGCLDRAKDRSFLFDALLNLEKCKNKAKIVEMAATLR